MKRIAEHLKRLSILLLCAFMFLSSPAALAAETEEGIPEGSIIDPEELQQQVEAYIANNNLNPENISIGYCYTATGDTWFYNGGKWYYSASMYKVPLFMIYAGKVNSGELTQESDINGMSLADLETKVLVYSNNDFAHHAMNYLAGTPGQTHDGDRKVREMYQQFSDKPKDYYVEDFYDYSYFTVEFMTDVMMKLYYESESFPNIIDCLKLAQPDSYFNRSMFGRYEVAQKYGAFKEFNNTTGIIYTPNPFILTVMTEFMGVNDGIISDMALMFEKYTLSLDEKLEAYRVEQEKAEQLRLEEEKKAAEEQARLEKEAEEAEKERQRLEAERLENERLQQERAEKRAKRFKILGITGGIILAGGIIALAAVKLRKPSAPRKSPEPERARRIADKPPARERAPERGPERATEKARRASHSSGSGRQAGSGSHATAGRGSDRSRGGKHYTPRH